jgi:uncharacterized protein YcfJ
MEAIRGIVCVVAIVAISGCSQNSPQIGATETGALAGSALGAGLGAIIGNQSGHTGGGIAIGAAAGALGGAVLGAQADRQNSAINEQEERIRRQEEELQRQRRELEDLRRGAPRDEYYDYPKNRGSDPQYDRNYDRSRY